MGVCVCGGNRGCTNCRGGGRSQRGATGPTGPTGPAGAAATGPTGPGGAAATGLVGLKFSANLTGAVTGFLSDNAAAAPGAPAVAYPVPNGATAQTFAAHLGGTLPLNAGETVAVSLLVNGSIVQTLTFTSATGAQLSAAGPFVIPPGGTVGMGVVASALATPHVLTGMVS